MDIAALKDLAQAATPGPWKPADNGWIDAPTDGFAVVQYLGCGSHGADWDEADYNFVLAANPSAVLELLASRDQLVAALKQLRAEADLAGFDERSGYGWPQALLDADAALAAAGA